MDAVGYVRVSTSEQNISGLGLEFQRQRITEFCKSQNLNLVEIIEEGNGLSGGVPIENRPAGSRLCKMIMSKGRTVRAVVTLKLDRAFRDTEDCLHHAKEWLHHGVAVHFLDLAGLDLSSGVGMMQLTMMAGFSEMERRLISDRTKSALSIKKARGEKTGGHVPYGYSWELNKEGVKILKPWKIEQEVIGLIKKMREMKLSPEKIAAKLNESGIKTKLGSLWSFKQIYRILAREDKNEKPK